MIYGIIVETFEFANVMLCVLSRKEGKVKSDVIFVSYIPKNDEGK